MAEQSHNRWLALYVLCAGMLMIVLDITIVNVALPSIQDDLGFSQAGLLPPLLLIGIAVFVLRSEPMPDQAAVAEASA